ncbi:hypothetical protein AMJ85_07465 [candidate division BRC1 bacterium SM23_51]|nr:MAG: hypothetical protein AMJ85_07465 [candidate division BRC1 bacterium SM23_51]
MIIEIVKDANGRETKLYRPENAQDVAELERMAKAGELDDSESMGDRDDDTEQDLVDAGILAPD